jgi:hypothetical protein
MYNNLFPKTEEKKKRGSVTQSQGREEYPTYNKKKDG